MPELTARLIDITSETFGIERAGITATARFVEDLGADSMDCVELMMAVEDACGLEFPDEDLSDLVAIGEVVAYIRRASVTTVGCEPASRPFPGRPVRVSHGVAARHGDGILAFGLPNLFGVSAHGTSDLISERRASGSS